MKKNELLELIKEVLELSTKKEADIQLENIDKIVEYVVEVLEVGQKVKLGQYITIEKKFVEEKSGVALGKEYVTPAHDAVKIKGTSLVKKLV